MVLLSKVIVKHEIDEIKMMGFVDSEIRALIKILENEYSLLEKIEKDCLQPVNSCEDLLTRMENKKIYFFTDDQIKYFNEAVKLCDEIKAICKG